MHVATVTEGQHTQSSSQESNHSQADDLKKMLQDVSNKLNLIDRLISLLWRKIECDYILIEFLILFHQKIKYDVGNQTGTLGM